ncbi:MAG: FeoA family protein [Elusimicrobia bacterium]|jgi:Fe2+ transport system protein FeoA|nr:FeoA family protein [Elusimicrobiota bacterium]
MSEIISLTNMKSGDTGKIIHVRGGLGMSRNLENMGIRIGTKIKIVNQQFMKGPVTVQIGNTQVAMGFGMANKVSVELDKREQS